MGCALACLCAFASLWLNVCLAQPPLEYQVKAAFLLNFAKFVTWPDDAFPDANAPVTICVYGRDPFGRTLDDVVQGETIDQRKVAVRRIEDLPKAQSCQAVFFENEERDLPDILGRLGRSILTVGEGEKFLRAGGMIGFLLENRRVRFDINQTAAEKAGLKLSSRLLSVARSVQK